MTYKEVLNLHKRAASLDRTTVNNAGFSAKNRTPPDYPTSNDAPWTGEYAPKRVPKRAPKKKLVPYMHPDLGYVIMVTPRTRARMKAAHAPNARPTGISFNPETNETRVIHLEPQKNEVNSVATNKSYGFSPGTPNPTDVLGIGTSTPEMTINSGESWWDGIARKANNRLADSWVGRQLGLQHRLSPSEKADPRYNPEIIDHTGWREMVQKLRKQDQFAISELVKQGWTQENAREYVMQLNYKQFPQYYNPAYIAWSGPYEQPYEIGAIERAREAQATRRAWERWRQSR